MSSDTVKSQTIKFQGFDIKNTIKDERICQNWFLVQNARIQCDAILMNLSRLFFYSKGFLSKFQKRVEKYFPSYRADKRIRTDRPKDRQTGRRR